MVEILGNTEAERDKGNGETKLCTEPTRRRGPHGAQWPFGLAVAAAAGGRRRTMQVPRARTSSDYGHGDDGGGGRLVATLRPAQEFNPDPCPGWPPRGPPSAGTFAMNRAQEQRPRAKNATQ